METKQLSLFEASSIVAGLGIGGGIMAVPYLAARNGVIPILTILFLAYGLSLLLHLMITEMVMRDEDGKQLVEIFKKFLFGGKAGQLLTWLFFILVLVNFYALLSAFIVGIGDLVVNLTGLPLWSAELIGYACAAGPIFFGLKVLGVSEKLAILGIAAIVLILTVASLGKPLNTVSWVSWSVRPALAMYGMVMFSFACFFSIPQAAKGLAHNRKLIPWSVVMGLGINLVLILVITLMAILVSEEVTELAIIGWGNAVGTWATILGSGFVLLAVLTSYWSTSYALAVILEERLGWQYRTSWLAATLPTLMIALSGFTNFLGFMRIAGGMLAILISIMVIPAFRGSKKHGAILQPEFSLTRWGSSPAQVLVIVAYLAVAIGTTLAID
ncbi:MAG: hypothetical protein JEZ11_01820 [Desulfobacterales bacterium]|nr:hypothetical protein [Desulfobacterales bacterium]